MATERQPVDLRLTGIHINLIEHVITLEAEDGRKAKLLFGTPTSPSESSRQPQRIQPSNADTPDELRDEDEGSWEELMPPVQAASPEAEAQAEPRESRERQQTIVLTGSLRTQPRSGRPDRQGNPTAWARFAVQEEDAEEPRIYSATFHRASAPIALGLAKGAQVTIEGYPHAGDPSRKRPDTLSVIALREYPGKVADGLGRGVT